MFWDENIWNESPDIEPNSKRARRIQPGIKGIMDLVQYEKGTFSWRW